MIPAALNAVIQERREVSPDLIVLRVGSDAALFGFKAGQYAVLGLPASVARLAMCGADDPPIPADRLIRRAYSIASSSRRGEYLEFYIKLVRSGVLTPRLFTLKAGDRIWLGPRPAGHFTLDSVPPEKNLVMVGTGTGLAPYISMIRSHHR